MSDHKTLRDELAMSAPFIQALSMGANEQDFEQHAKERYRYADIAIRVRSETMPKPSVKHPEWARWAARDEDGECFYFENEPVPDDNFGNGLWCHDANKVGLDEKISGNPSWIPSNWRESKVKL